MMQLLIVLWTCGIYCGLVGLQMLHVALDFCRSHGLSGALKDDKGHCFCG
jgi:hypothetical protein